MQKKVDSVRQESSAPISKEELEVANQIAEVFTDIAEGLEKLGDIQSTILDVLTDLAKAEQSQNKMVISLAQLIKRDLDEIKYLLTPVSSVH